MSQRNSLGILDVSGMIPSAAPPLRNKSNHTPLRIPLTLMLLPPPSRSCTIMNPLNTSICVLLPPLRKLHLSIKALPLLLLSPSCSQQSSADATTTSSASTSTRSASTVTASSSINPSHWLISQQLPPAGMLPYHCICLLHAAISLQLRVPLVRCYPSAAASCTLPSHCSCRLHVAISLQLPLARCHLIAVVACTLPSHRSCRMHTATPYALHLHCCNATVSPVLQLHLQLTTYICTPAARRCCSICTPAAHHRCCSTCSSPPLLLHL